MAIQSQPIANVFDTFGTWFTDIDDGTMVRISPIDRQVFGFTVVPGSIRLYQNVVPYECHQIEYEQEPIVTNIGTININGFKLEIDNMPADFSTDVSSDCSLARLPDRLVLYVYETTPTRQDLPATLVASSTGDVKHQQGPLGGFITRYEFVNVEEIGTTSASANQTYSAGSDIELPTKGTPTIYLGELGKNKWTVVENFSESGPNSKVFTYNKEDGKVTFGNGVNGAIPPAGKKVILRISIRNSGGKWKYNGIVVPKATDPRSLGLLKSIRKKLFYGSTKIAGADAAVVTEVESTLNVIEQQHIGLDGSTLMGVRRAWSLAYGGEVKITSGPGNVKSTTIGKAFVVERGETIEEDDPERDKKFIAWEGAFGQEVTGTLPNQTPDMEDQEIAFFAGNNAREGLGGFDGNSGQDYNAQTTPAELGFFTSPEVYKAVFKVLPIFWITEEIGIVDEITSTQQIGVNPATIEVTLEGYQPSEYYHAEMGFHPDPNQFDDDDHLYVEDINRTLAITAIANEEGTIEEPVFDDEQITDENASGRTKQTIASPGNHWTVFAWPSVQFSFIYENQSDNTEHPEWFKLTMACSSKYPDYETHIFGEPLPDFVINWTVVQGTKTTYTVTNVLPDPTEDIVYVMA